jgi:hypothetical protein
MPELNWNEKNNPEIKFPKHYWKWIENTFTQFEQGKHSVTKSYDEDGGFIGFTDDYDFCWGPVNEGEIVEGEYTPENGRLWGIYTKTEGEIYLLKANEDLTDWERHEQLVFAPSGSRRATITFRPDGHYEIGVELLPAGSETYEIWLMSYPYETDDIRQICDGTEPQLMSNFLNNPILFYTDNAQYNIYYRLYTNSYNTEYSIDIVNTPERQLHLRYAGKGFKPSMLGGDRKDGYILAFYKRDDDYQPYKYTITDLAYTNPPLTEKYELGELNVDTFWQYINEIISEQNKDNYELNDVNLDNIVWVDISAIDGGTHSDNYDLGNVGLDNIAWEDISAIISENNVESYEVNSIGLDSILWVEV